MGRETSHAMWQFRVKNPSHWHGNAEVFQHAVSKLLPVVKAAETDIIVPDGDYRLKVFVPPLSPPLRGTITLLQGLAIENLVKAILIALCPSRFVVGEGLTDEFVKHNLQELIRIVNELLQNTILLKGRMQLLRKLAATVEWAKYGVPKTATQFHETREQGVLSQLVPRGGYALTDDEIDTYNKLYEELEHIYHRCLEESTK